jgi:hypothetical protein
MPTEARDDLGIPGRPGDRPETPGRSPSDEEERRDDLAERTRSGEPMPAGEGSPDVLPEVEIPEHHM